MNTTILAGFATERQKEVLAPLDAYAANAGYRSGRDMKSIIMHKLYGEVGRSIVNPRMLQ
jgi:hypothetical protein